MKTKNFKPNKKNKELKVTLLIIFAFMLAHYFLISPYYKIRDKRIFDNASYNIALYYEYSTPAKGASTVDYKFNVNGKKYKGHISPSKFKEENSEVGKNYIVAYNSKNPSENICFLNLEVHDSIQHYFKNGSLSQLPIEDYQRTVDSFFLEMLTESIRKYFPPYYKKEDFLELEYLWGEKE